MGWPDIIQFVLLIEGFICIWFATRPFGLNENSWLGNTNWPIYLLTYIFIYCTIILYILCVFKIESYILSIITVKWYMMMFRLIDLHFQTTISGYCVSPWSVSWRSTRQIQRVFGGAQRVSTTTHHVLSDSSKSENKAGAG